MGGAPDVRSTLDSPLTVRTIGTKYVLSCCASFAAESGKLLFDPLELISLIPWKLSPHFAVKETYVTFIDGFVDVFFRSGWREN